LLALMNDVADMSGSRELQTDLAREGAVKVLVDLVFSEDVRVQPDVSRAFASLTLTEEIRQVDVLE
jgi:hypothetical protein